MMMMGLRESLVLADRVPATWRVSPVHGGRELKPLPTEHWQPTYCAAPRQENLLEVSALVRADV
jgi:hypothetical protein